MKHTPTPYRRESEATEPTDRIVIETDERTIFRIDLPDEEDFANAAFLVAAANAHDKLVEALKSIANKLDYTDNVDELWRCKNIARAALALVEQPEPDSRKGNEK